MASILQQPNQSNQSRKMSGGNKAGGKDVLSRMLQMEREVKDQRVSPTDFITPSEGQWVSSHRDGQGITQVPSLPAFVAPEIEKRNGSSEAKIQAKKSQRKADLKINTAEVKADARPDEICLSPSWSDHGEKKRKKERKQRDRERKEREKKAKEASAGQQKNHKQDEGGGNSKTGGIKAGKRADKKPPPAAMETQKMPSGLRRNSIVSLFSSRSSSREGSRRNSLAGDDRRLSGLSLSSFTSQRSHTTPPTSEESTDNSEHFRKVVSATAPRLPSFNWKPGRDSNDIGKSVAAWNHEAAYEKEVVSLAYRLDATAFIAESEKIEKKRSQPEQPPRKSHFKEHTDANARKSPPAQRVSPVPGSPTKNQTRPTRPPQQQNSRQKLRKKKKVDVAMRDQQATTKASPPAAINANNKAARPSKKATPIAVPAEARKKRPETPLALELPATQVKPAYDGSSYVHKQRMYQQQMSITGFEEQETVQLANEEATATAAAADKDEEEAKDKPDTAPEMTRPHRNATVLRAHQDHWRDSQSTLFPLTSESQFLKDTPPQSRKHTLKQSQFSTPVSQSTKTAIMGDHPPPSSLGRHPIFAQDSETTPNNVDPPAGGMKSDKVLGFRKRPKPTPLAESDKLPDGHQNPLSSHPVRPEEPASRRLRMEKMFIDPISAQLPFRKRTNSEGSATLPAPPERDANGSFRGHYRNRTNSSEALTMDLPSPVPRVRPMEIPKPLSINVHEQTLASKLEQKALESSISTVPAKEDKLFGDSNKAESEVSSLSTREGGNHSKTVSESSFNQPSPITEEFKPAETKELKRYTLVETIQPKVPNPKESATSNPQAPKILKPILKSSKKASPETDNATTAPKTELEMVARRINRGTVTRKTSTTRAPPSSAPPPQKQTSPTTPTALPSLDFLPQLKHQPLIKRNTPLRTTSDSIIPRFPAPPPIPLSPITSTPPTLPALKPRSPLRTPITPFAPPPPVPIATSTTNTTTTAPTPPINRSSTSVLTAATTTASTSSLLTSSDATLTTATLSAKPIAKLFIICCKCRYWHDLPSRLYEAMAFPQEVASLKAKEEEESGKADHNKDVMAVLKGAGVGGGSAATAGGDDGGGERKEWGAEGGEAAEGGGVKLPDMDEGDRVQSSVVKCPWCEHAMSTWCCQGWTTVVYLHQRHH